MEAGRGARASISLLEVRFRRASPTDETDIANIIVNLDPFALFKRVVVDSPDLIVEGPLQKQDGAVCWFAL